MSLDEFTFCVPFVVVMTMITCFSIKLVYQESDIKHLCFKVVQTELKNDPEIQDICKDVKITLGEINK